MVGSVMQKAFVRVLVLIILNLEFWLFSFAGLLILGVGPAFRATMETYLNHGFNYQLYSLKESWKIYKKYFWTANLHFYIFFAVTVFLFYDIYISSQIKTGWMLPIMIIMVFLAFFVPIIGLFTLNIESVFEVKFTDAVKLAISEFFADFSGLWKFVAGIIVILALTKFFPGLLLFMSMSALIVWCHFTTKDWINNVEGQLE